MMIFRKHETNTKLLQSLWENGCFNIQDMVFFVDQEYITEQEFFEITRKYYQPVKEKVEKERTKKIMASSD